jgi:hypothetical protein
MRTHIVVGIFFASIVAVLPYQTFATESIASGVATATVEFRFNNENWFTMPHPKIISFTVHQDGSATGLTETGIVFNQYNVPNNTGIRIQKFEIQDHYHYVIDGEPVYALEEFSKRLAEAES